MVRKIRYFGLKYGKDFKKCTAHSTQILGNFLPPPPPPLYPASIQDPISLSTQAGLFPNVNRTYAITNRKRKMLSITCNLYITFLAKLHVLKSLIKETQRKMATIAHAKIMMTLTTGTLAPLHRSPLQQLNSHLVILVLGSWTTFLQLASSQSDFVAQPLTYNETDIS